MGDCPVSQRENTMTLPSTLGDHDELMARIARDLVDSYDEEIELELEDRNLDELESGIITDKAGRQAYFKELFRLQGELVKLHLSLIHI